MKKSDISNGITAFIDILGFGNRVLRTTSFEDIKSIKEDISFIQNEFYFEATEQSITDVQKIYKTTVLAFSDCVIVNLPFDSDGTRSEGTFDPLMSELANFAYGQGSCCQNSLFIRGGIDLGWWYQNGSTLISKSMVNAYKTEGNASVPVIALTDDLYRFFCEHKHRNYYSKDWDPIPDMFREYSNGTKSFMYLDYISICLRSIDWVASKNQMENYKLASSEEKNLIVSQGYKLNADLWLNKHARNIESAYDQAVEKCVKEKYEWLSNYHNEITERFTTNQDCNCVLK